jgi:hypothetical protein
MPGTQVYRPTLREQFQWVQPVSEADFESVYTLSGTPHSASWQPIRVTMLNTSDRGENLLWADLPWLGEHALVFRDEVLDAASKVLGPNGEFLELIEANTSEKLWLFNGFEIAGALIEEESELVRFPSSGRVMMIKRHSFRGEVLDGRVAFRIRQSKTLFLTAKAVDAFRSLGLTGAGFELVWESKRAD